MLTKDGAIGHDIARQLTVNFGHPRAFRVSGSTP